MNATVNTPKAVRKQFGVGGQKIQATQAFRRPMNFDHPGTTAYTWTLITPEGTRVVANAYNGNLGRNFNIADFTHSIPTDTKGQRKVLKGYEEVPVSECPFAEAVEGGTVSIDLEAIRVATANTQSASPVVATAPSTGSDSLTSGGGEDTVAANLGGDFDAGLEQSSPAPVESAPKNRAGRRNKGGNA